MMDDLHNFTAADNREQKFPTAAELLAVMNDFREKYPLRRVPKSLHVGRGTMFDIDMTIPKGTSISVHNLDGLPVYLATDKPANWAEIEYMDGHRERVYWFGRAKGEG